MNTHTPTPDASEIQIAPWLTVDDGSKAIEFYGAAFGAVEKYKLVDDDGRPVVALLSVKGAHFWIQEDPNFAPDSSTQGPIRMILTVRDPDTVFSATLTSGAAQVYPIAEEHGWRIGRIRDPFGHEWEIGRKLD